MALPTELDWMFIWYGHAVQVLLAVQYPQTHSM